MSQTALYTTVYPGAEKYIPFWYRSVEKQTYKDFDVVIGLDSYTPKQFFKCLGKEIKAEFITAEAGQSPAKVRENAFRYIVKKYQDVILTDIDDILLEQRVKAAVEELRYTEINACSMEIIDVDSQSTGYFFPVGTAEIAYQKMFRANVFGLTNTAYRCEILKGLMPFPKECVMLDWFMVTKAWLNGARLSVSNKKLMRYRQYTENTARTLSPFTGEQVLKACTLLHAHYKLLNQNLGELSTNKRFAEAVENLKTFTSSMKNKDNLNTYVHSLNKLNKEHCWWEWIALPELEEIWKN